MNQFKRYLYRFSIKQKMIVAFLTVSLLGVLTIAVTAQFYYTRATTQDFYNIARGSSASLNHQIDRYFKQLSQSTSAVIAGPLRSIGGGFHPNQEAGAIQAWMTGKEPLTLSNRLVIEDTLRRYIAINYSEIESLVLLKENGELVSSNGQVEYRPEEPWLRLPFTEKTVVIPTYESYPYQIPIVSLVIPVYSTENTRLVGRLVINLSLSEIKEIMGKTSIGKTGKFIIISSSDTIVYHPDASLLGKPLLKTSLGDLRLSVSDTLQKVGSLDYLITFTQSDFTEWRILAVVPLQEMATGLNVATKSMLIVLLFLFLFVILVVPISTKLLMEPVVRLKQVMYQVERGNLDVQVEYHPGKDELQSLNRSFGQMIGRLNDLIDDVYRYQLREMQLEVRQKDAMIKALQGQINPHFLYNTLDIIRSIAFLEEVPRIEKITGNLAAFFRYTAKLEPLEVTLREEIDHLRKYLEIIDIRFKQNFQSQVYVNEKFMEVRLVKLSLQPIVENAVKYAVEPMNGNAAILINAFDEGDDLILEVADNGPGIPRDKLEDIRRSLAQVGEQQAEGHYAVRDSLGLANVHARLVLRYGGRYGVSIDSFPARGTVVSIRFPYEKTSIEAEQR
ncbi:sensor histidine kinase [Paenibacillus sp. V4I7]|uniref:sensor histidine kinase n=1 Tax=Paenibacillus sp. V4I7 TaxID=3042307 RepID=UPI00278745B4|nr:sensor histidine kinase [Paenibacillus sp. V4I7]MDQ0901073.1 two-component system sensor histidine kinase YesM [Paenibacillus sp. V4I7]